MNSQEENSRTEITVIEETCLIEAFCSLFFFFFETGLKLKILFSFPESTQSKSQHPLKAISSSPMMMMMMLSVYSN